MVVKGHRRHGQGGATPWSANKIRHNYYGNFNARKRHIPHRPEEVCVQSDHIGTDTEVHCLSCQHHHCVKCGKCHRCGCERFVPNPKEQSRPDLKKRVEITVPYELRERLKKRMKHGETSIASVIRDLLDKVEGMEKL